MLNPDFRDILSEFLDAGVEFMLVGAYALAAHGLPRATGDIDLWVRCSPENARRIMVALAGFGAPLSDVSTSDFLEPRMVVQFGVNPRRIDVITLIDGVTFDEAWPERITVEVDGLDVPVIGRDHLIRNKIAAGRTKDIADARRLKQRKPPRF